MSPQELSPIQAQYLPDLSLLCCVNHVTEFSRLAPAVLLLFMSWSISCREAIVQLMSMQQAQPGVFFACITKEHSSTVRAEMRSLPELSSLNVYTDPRHALKSFLIANSITTVPTAMLFAPGGRMAWNGHALSSLFVDKFTKLVRQAHIRVCDEGSLSFKVLRSSSYRSVSASRTDHSRTMEDSSTMQDEHSSRVDVSPKRRPEILMRSTRRPTSVQRGEDSLERSIAREVPKAVLQTGDLTLSAIMAKKLAPSSPVPPRSLTITPTRSMVSSNKQGSTQEETSDCARRYLINSPLRRRVEPPRPLKSPVDHLKAERSEVTGEESSHSLADRMCASPPILRPRLLHRSPAIAEEVKGELGWMLIKQDAILPRPLRLPASFPTNVLTDTEGTQKLFNSSAMFLRRMNL